MDVDHPYIIYMKAGPYCGYELEEIIDIKQREDTSCGCFFWGYGGVLCHPRRVLAFVDHASRDDAEPLLMFSETPSRFKSIIGRATEYSLDGTKWETLPSDVLLVGNKYALVATNLRRVRLRLNLGSYRSMLGNDLGKTLDKYLVYRVDKSCAVYDPGAPTSDKAYNVN